MSSLRRASFLLVTSRFLHPADNPYSGGWYAAPFHRDNGVGGRPPQRIIRRHGESSSAQNPAPMRRVSKYAISCYWKFESFVCRRRHTEAYRQPRRRKRKREYGRFRVKTH